MENSQEDEEESTLGEGEAPNKRRDWLSMYGPGEEDTGPKR